MITTKVGLAKQAYQGAPHGVRNQWPDEVSFSPEEHWSWDKSQVIRRKSLAATLRQIKRKNIIDSM